MGLIVVRYYLFSSSGTTVCVRHCKTLLCVPRRFVLVSVLYIPATTYEKFIYAEDIALLIKLRNFADLGDALNNDLKTVDEYLNKWSL